MSGDPEVRARRIAEEITDPDRTRPVVAVSVAADRTSPLVDVEELRARLGDAATVHLLRTGEETWALKRLLPRGHDVFGDAVRVWRPGNLGAQDHPLLLLHDGPAPAELLTWVAGLVGGSGHEHGAVVTSVSDEGALLRLPDGRPVTVAAHQVTRLDVPVAHVLRPAQRVRVLVTDDLGGGETLRGTLVPFEPDPATRLRSEYVAGDVVLARVIAAGPRTARVELLPGLVTEVPSTSLAETSGPGAPVVAVELLGLGEPGEPAARVSVRAVPERAWLAQAASLLPDGPPWLAPPEPAEVQALPPLTDDHWDGAANARRSWSEAAPPDEEDLAGLVRRADVAHEDLRLIVGGLDDTLAGMRARAAELRHQLELDLVEVRERVLRTVEAERDALEGSTAEALAQARAEIDRLRARLAEATGEGDSLRSEVDDLRRSEERHRAELARAHRASRAARDRVRSLQRELDSYVPAEERFRNAVRTSWLRHTTKADRERFPWRDPRIGPSFLASLEEIEGVSLDRVADVCAEVVSGRARTRPGLQVHALRSSAGGGSAQLVRDDGARAFRASLQVRSAAARRLHYWVLPDGTVELARIGYHDDFSIS